MSCMNTLTIRIPGTMRRDLQRLARRNHQPVSDLVRDSLRRYVAAEKFRELRSATLSFAADRGFVTDDDVFKAIS